VSVSRLRVVSNLCTRLCKKTSRFAWWNQGIKHQLPQPKPISNPITYTLLLLKVYSHHVKHPGKLQRIHRSQLCAPQCTMNNIICSYLSVSAAGKQLLSWLHSHSRFRFCKQMDTNLHIMEAHSFNGHIWTSRKNGPDLFIHILVLLVYGRYVFSTFSLQSPGRTELNQ
jgi:hypothetical protein